MCIFKFLGNKVLGIVRNKKEFLYQRVICRVVNLRMFGSGKFFQKREKFLRDLKILLKFILRIVIFYKGF